MRDYKYLLDKPTKQETFLESFVAGLAFITSLASMYLLLALLSAGGGV